MRGLMRAHSLSFTLVWVGALVLSSCSTPPEPDTGVDLETPVMDLPGWPALIDSLDLPEGRDVGLARWVEVFREGLDIARGGADEARRLQIESDWWTEAERSLEAVVGPDNVGEVLAWLEGLYGRRGEAS